MGMFCTYVFRMSIFVVDKEGSLDQADDIALDDVDLNVNIYPVLD